MTGHDSYRWWWHGLNWNGRASVIYYAVRRRFIAPAPAAERCFMGAPVGAAVHCPRWALPGSLWCERHEPADPATEGTVTSPPTTADEIAALTPVVEAIETYVDRLRAERDELVGWWDDVTPVDPAASHRAIRVDRFDDYHRVPLYRRLDVPAADLARQGHGDRLAEALADDPWAATALAFGAAVELLDDTGDEDDPASGDTA